MIKLNGFARMQDTDYPFPHNNVILFDINEKYILKGKTHSLISHGIKHLIEWEPTFVKNILLSMRSKLKIELLYFFKQPNLIRELKKSDLTDEVLLNTLDLINDKLEINEKLYEMELPMKNILLDIRDRYKSWCSKLENAAIEIFDNDDYSFVENKINTSRVIWFNVSYRGVDMQNILDFRNNLYMSVHNGMVRTLFKMSDDFIQRQYKGKAKIKNLHLEKKLLEK